jgi:hypothetical protein
MFKVIAGVFLLLHGLVHLLYYGQSARRFELQPGMVWPDGSWVFSRLLGENGTRMLAGIFCILATAGMLVGGVGMMFGQSWWRSVVIASAAVSGALYILFWNGRMQHLDRQGGIGLLIDAGILVSGMVG